MPNLTHSELEQRCNILINCNKHWDRHQTNCARSFLQLLYQYNIPAARIGRSSLNGIGIVIEIKNYDFTVEILSNRVILTITINEKEKLHLISTHNSSLEQVDFFNKIFSVIKDEYKKHNNDIEYSQDVEEQIMDYNKLMETLELVKNSTKKPEPSVGTSTKLPEFEITDIKYGNDEPPNKSSRNIIGELTEINKVLFQDIYQDSLSSMEIQLSEIKLELKETNRLLTLLLQKG